MKWKSHPGVQMSKEIKYAAVRHKHGILGKQISKTSKEICYSLLVIDHKCECGSLKRKGSKGKANSDSTIIHDYIEEEKGRQRPEETLLLFTMFSYKRVSPRYGIHFMKLSRSVTCQEKLEPEATETTSSSVERRGRKELTRTIVWSSRLSEGREPPSPALLFRSSSRIGKDDI